MSDSPSKSFHEPTHLAQDHEKLENASAQEPPPPYNPPPAYTETKEASPPNMIPPPEYKETPSSISHAPTTKTVFVVPMEFHSKLAEVTCPYCNVPITTRVVHEAVMSDPSSKSFYDTTPLVQDNKNQENASAQEPPPPYNPSLAYTETKGAPPPNMTPPPEYKKTPSSIPYAPTTKTVFVVPIEFNSKPAEVTCSYCNVPITTHVEHEAGTMTWMLCCFVSIFVLCCNFTKDVNHFCPICQRRLGRYRRPCSTKIVMFVVLIIGISIILNILCAILLACYGSSNRYHG